MEQKNFVYTGDLDYSEQLWIESLAHDLEKSIKERNYKTSNSYRQLLIFAIDAAYRKGRFDQKSS